MLRLALYSALKEGYSFKSLMSDITAGLTVAIVALPMSLAFAIAAGATPLQGIYTAIIASVLGGLTSGGRFQVLGPTTTFAILITSLLYQFDYQVIFAAMMLAAVILVIMGLSGLGATIKFVPYPVIIGYTSGVAVCLFISQLPYVLGLQLTVLRSHTFTLWAAMISHIREVNRFAFGIGLSSIVITFLWPRLVKNGPRLLVSIPGSLVAIVLTTAAAALLNFPVETLAARFGPVSAQPLSIGLPDVPWSVIPQIVEASIAIALLASIESLLCASVSDGMTGYRHSSNMELVSQGIANFGCALAGCIPATASVARTAVNIKAGAATPLSSLFQAIALLLAVFWLAPLVGLIPMATLAGILIVIAYNISEWRHYLYIFRSPASDVALLLVSFILTVVVDVVAAIEVGILLSALLFVNRTAQVTGATDLKLALSQEEDSEEIAALKGLDIPSDVDVFEIYGSLFFAAAEKFKMTLKRIGRQPKVLILRMRRVITVDATGIRALRDICTKARKKDVTLILCGLQPHLKHVLERAQFLDEVGKENVFPDIEAAVVYAKELIAPRVKEKVSDEE